MITKMVENNDQVFMDFIDWYRGPFKLNQNHASHTVMNSDSFCIFPIQIVLSYCIMLNKQLASANC